VCFVITIVYSVISFADFPNGLYINDSDDFLKNSCKFDFYFFAAVFFLCDCCTSAFLVVCSTGGVSLNFMIVWLLSGHEEQSLNSYPYFSGEFELISN
jgi:hypothetical protein